MGTEGEGFTKNRHSPRHSLEEKGGDQTRDAIGLGRKLVMELFDFSLKNSKPQDRGPEEKAQGIPPTIAR